MLRGARVGERWQQHVKVKSEVLLITRTGNFFTMSLSGGTIERQKTACCLHLPLCYTTFFLFFTKSLLCNIEKHKHVFFFVFFFLFTCVCLGFRMCVYVLTLRLKISSPGRRLLLKCLLVKNSIHLFAATTCCPLCWSLSILVTL